MEHFMLSQKENKEHSTQLVPYSYYRSDIPDLLPDSAIHWHTEMEINYVRSGEGLYQVGSEHRVCRAGDIIVIPPNVLHSVYPIDDKKISTDTLVFHMDFIGAAFPDRASVTYLRPFFNGNVSVTPFIESGMKGYEDYTDCLVNVFRYLTERPEYFEKVLKLSLHVLSIFCLQILMPFLKAVTAVWLIMRIKSRRLFYTFRKTIKVK